MSSWQLQYNDPIKRADINVLKDVFERYASVTEHGAKFMTNHDFFVKFLNLFPDVNYDKDSLKVLSRVIDKRDNNRITFADFQAFEGNLCVPDALYRTAFTIFDTNGDGTVCFNEFKSVLEKTTCNKTIPYDMDSDFIKMYFGKKKERKITYLEFTQFLHDFMDDHARIGFQCKDTEGKGFITASDFTEIMTSMKGDLMSNTLRDNLMLAAQIGDHGHYVSYAFFNAFLSLLQSMDLIKKVYLHATRGSRQVEVTKEEFLHAAKVLAQITPQEVEILFRLADLQHQTGKINYQDLQDLDPNQMAKQVMMRITEVQAVSKPEDRGVAMQMLESIYRFTLGSVAGATGASAVYPIDLVKTRMQNQRSSYMGEIMYRNSVDCFKKVVRHEGVAGLYRGLLPQLMGVAPEKAIKLTMNDLVRDKMTDKKTGYIPVYGEVLAGACGGASQVMFTNPLEIVKIRLQVAGEIGTGPKVKAWPLVKELGLLGLYKGSFACILRDVPFSAIYFPTYAHLKKSFADDSGYISPLSILTAGAIAGAPAASLVTPADVIKTRLQVKARAGQTVYNGVFDATRKIYAEEGFRAFWKGAVARMCRSSPQFGVTLSTYELLQRVFYVDFGGIRPVGEKAEGLETVKIPSHPDHIGGYKIAKPIFDGVESKFGICLPKVGEALVESK